METYVSGLDTATATALDARVRAAVAQLQGRDVELRLLGFFALVEEETCMWILEAAGAGEVAGVSRRAGVRDWHVAEVTTLEPDCR